MNKEEIIKKMHEVLDDDDAEFFLMINDNSRGGSHVVSTKMSRHFSGELKALADEIYSNPNYVPNDERNKPISIN